MTTAHWEKVGAKTEAGPDVTTRRIVTPKPGLVYHESGGSGDSVAAEGKVKLNHPEGFESKILQPVSFWVSARMKGWLKG